VPDPVLREKLTPKYSMGCKRILFTNDYYPALQRPNVELVTDAIVEVRERSIVTTDGREHEVDAIVLATGFAVADEPVPFPVEGRDGRTLKAAWKDGAEAYLGTTVAGFPNLFLLVGPNTGLGHSSMIFMIEAQAGYTLECLKWERSEGVRWADVRPEVQARYNEKLQARLSKSLWQQGGCHSWYQNKSGKNVTLWPGFTFEFSLRLRRFDPESYERGRGSAAHDERSTPVATNGAARTH
jgi:cation diffusion facilitator CzcD-associated flavoprotein CzcO